ncbi:PREDICTED: uncharacterized protein LOC106101309 [Papilio polytes]|uniref:uncharacterized protein LOC106101309 n=1 Tax=Papilio polytes TaxID=76194 RepID=UPI000676A8EF|nr:PREDICTED: uncharacterized protein LOC106101309 [Papilio polytes]
MTVFAKGCLLPNKNEIAKLPLVEEVACPDAKVELPPLSETPEPQCHQVPGPLRRCCTMLFHLMNISLLLFLFVAMSVLIYRQYVKSTSVRHYQGYCTIPDMKNQRYLIEPNSFLLVSWSPEPVEVSSDDAVSAERLSGMLREQFDIDSEAMMEKISVFNNGHLVNFIHDFNNNMTSIVDEERCFILDLDLERVLQPEALIARIARGGAADVARVRSQLRADLPDLALPASLPDLALPAACRARPTYRLLPDRDRQVRKRAAEGGERGAGRGAAQYVHFSGKAVHEIDIRNLPQLLQRERRRTHPAPHTAPHPTDN